MIKIILKLKFMKDYINDILKILQRTTFAQLPLIFC